MVVTSDFADVFPLSPNIVKNTESPILSLWNNSNKAEEKVSNLSGAYTTILSRVFGENLEFNRESVMEMNMAE